MPEDLLAAYLVQATDTASDAILQPLGPTIRTVCILEHSTSVYPRIRTLAIHVGQLKPIGRKNTSHSILVSSANQAVSQYDMDKG